VPALSIAKHELDLLILGDINPDLIVVDDDPQPVFGDVEKIVESASLQIGGSAAICACAAARLGLETALLGVTGDDLFGRQMLAELTEKGVDVSSCIVDPSVATGVTIVLARARDRAMLTYLGAIGRLRVAHVPPALLKRTRHLHVGSYFLLDEARPDLPGLFREAHDMGVTTSVDCNWDPADRWESDLLELIDVADVFFCNVREAERITGYKDARVAGVELARHASAAVIKAGRYGAVGVSGGEVIEAGAPMVQAIDTVGAGDTFDAGFLSRWIEGNPLLDCLRFGVACGSLSTGGVGGTSSQPTVAEASALAEGLPVRA
jgi:sugar/nucleoside kinase (ribokinase family)